MSEHIKYIEEFELAIRGINVKDFGDFRRKANSYLIRLAEKIENSSNKKQLIEIQNFVNFKPDWQIESTRRNIIKKIREIK